MAEGHHQLTGVFCNICIWNLKTSYLLQTHQAASWLKGGLQCFLGKDQILCFSLRIENHSLYCSHISVIYPQLHMKISSLCLLRSWFISFSQFLSWHSMPKTQNQSIILFFLQFKSLLFWKVSESAILTSSSASLLGMSESGQ